MGNHVGRTHALWLYNYRDVAYAYRDAQPQCWFRHQRTCFVHCPRMSSSPSRCANSITPPVSERTESRVTFGAQENAAWEHCPGGSCPGEHWPRNEDLFTLQQGRRIGWDANENTHGSAID